MFEIRWHDLEIRCHKVGTGDVEERVEVRLIYVEPDGHGAAVIGLRGHEKVVVSGNDELTRELQDDQIDAACRLYAEGQRRGWPFWE